MQHGTSGCIVRAVVAGAASVHVGSKALAAQLRGACCLAGDCGARIVGPAMA
jgi:hypothetical protein